ncbi:FAD binding domain-containing protein [Rhizobium sp. NFR03]|uniref:FAD binding domain-containing protein n=1 Tax=Rhizobium sp. NFR03 TaxID=1566263 RepID=UPI0008AFF301|nr:FAD binding domain-containing protein [Rhizobium sp. NFR03]SES40822.1 carbon-monoxide dehydrogenase medium subunit [Rhizobium sp. NFR03]
MTVDLEERSLMLPETVEGALAARLDGATILAGGTWLMRAPLRRESITRALVSLQAIPGLGDIAIGTDRVRIGASVTHEALARSLAGIAGLEAVATAASGAANPAIRRVATVGGNLCTRDFAAADLLPAFLATEAIVELRTRAGAEQLPIAVFLDDRARYLTDTLLVSVILPRNLVASTHMRLPLRKAGDYPVAILSVARDRDRRLRFAVGSVEPVARRWHALEEALAPDRGDMPLDPERTAALAASCNDFKGRDGPEADGWYRRQVLPALARRAAVALARQEGIR